MREMSWIRAFGEMSLESKPAIEMDRPSHELHVASSEEHMA